MQNSRARTLLVKTVLILVAKVTRVDALGSGLWLAVLAVACCPRDCFRAWRRDLLAA